MHAAPSTGELREFLDEVERSIPNGLDIGVVISKQIKRYAHTSLRAPICDIQILRSTQRHPAAAAMGKVSR